MGDTYIKLIPQKLQSDEVNSLVQKILVYLIERKIVRPEKTDCTLGDPGYPPGEKYTDIVVDDYGILNLRTNGLEIISGTRTAFWTNGLDEIKCPNCNENIIDSEWGQAIDEWTNNTGKDQIECSVCKTTNSITDYVFEPDWGFGELGFTFWNWFGLKKEFITELERIADKKIKVIYGKL